jgi:hypothetical protein
LIGHMVDDLCETIASATYMRGDAG